MPLLSITNLTSSQICIQDPTGFSSLSFTVQGNGVVVDKVVTVSELAAIEPQLKQKASGGFLLWTTKDDPNTLTDSPANLQPAFTVVEKFIYARTSGSDTAGNGTLANPYRTFQRAIRDVPTVIPPGTIYRVDITDLGLETLPSGYRFPAFVAPEGIGDFDFSHPYFHYYGAVNVQATPKLATGVAGITTIPSAGAVVSTPRASTGLVAIQSPDAGWTPGQLKGKFAVGAGLGNNHGVIWDNTSDTIYVTRTAAPTLPIRIMECSAHLQGPRDADNLHTAALNITNSPVSLLGIKVSSDGSDPGQFGMWGLQTAGPQTVSLQLCDLPGAGFETLAWTRVRACYLPNVLFLMAPNLIIESYIHRSIEVVSAGPRASVWGARGMDSLLRKTVVEGTVPIHFRDLFDNFHSGSIGMLQLQNVQILDPIAEFPPGMEGAHEHGLLWTGGVAILSSVDIRRTSAGNGSAIYARGPGARVVLRGVTGANFNIGVTADDGAHVEQHDDGGTATALVGTTGAFKCGSIAAEAAWPSVVYPATGGNFADFSGEDATGSRIWRRS